MTAHYRWWGHEKLRLCHIAPLSVDNGRSRGWNWTIRRAYGLFLKVLIDKSQRCYRTKRIVSSFQRWGRGSERISRSLHAPTCTSRTIRLSPVKKKDRWNTDATLKQTVTPETPEPTSGLLWVVTVWLLFRNLHWGSTLSSSAFRTFIFPLRKSYSYSKYNHFIWRV